MRQARAVLLAVALAAAPALAAPPKETKRITLDVTRANIHDVLRMLADVGRMNLVVADEVQGTVTLKLRNVPWTEALDVVLASRGLGMQKQGNILRVAPLKALQEEAEALARLKKAKAESAPLRTFFIPVSHANAAEMAQHVKGVLSPRGSVSVDTRTNTLIVTDVEAPSLP
ncbi:secretin and TonB N-terminal domain-containing protein [Archangium sp.]|jgi:type IV pilus assembly protein PilQ|uniref:secretin and TonB N-terminal domain-containing protein n=1 Tax=Archangium sp. TaxID=1872627 RepID=UPI002EDACC97